jgi:hypothetical protein
MKKILLVVCLLICASGVMAQKVYQIRADSVRIYNTCDTAELIIENRTKDTLGFLYNKGNGRTEFSRLHLQTVGANSIAITGQDTLQLGAIIKTAVDTIYQLNGTLYYRKTNGVVVSVPISANETLQSVMARGNTTDQNIQFTSPVADPSNGVNWHYNTDYWRIYVQSLQDTPSGNMILESGDNDTEGWIFRNNASSGSGLLDVLSLGRDRFLYNGYTVYHSGNFSLGDYIKGGTFQNSEDWNSLVTSGFMGSVYSQTNSPLGNDQWWNMISSRHRNGNGDGNMWGMQIAQGMTSNTNRIFFRSQENGTWNGWKEFWHSGNVNFATKGNDIALKTEANGYLGLENWIRSGNNTGFFTPDGSYLYKNGNGSWAIRSTAGVESCWLELQTGEGTNRGGFYADASGNIGIVNANANGWRFRMDASGNAYANGFYQTSMRSLKRDIEPFNTSALNILTNASVRSFIYKADSAGIKHIGFIADELPDEMAAPGRQGVDEGNTVALLVKALQEMNKKVEALQKTVETLQTKVAAYEK